jgi:hypothetical protein
MNYRLLISKLLVLIAVAGLSLSAQAANEFAWGGLNTGCYTYPAVAMTPYDRSIQDDLYRMTHEQVYHNTGATGSILLYGTVRPWEMYGDGITFTATYKDPDGRGTDASVVAQLRYVDASGIHILKTLNSNDHAFATTDVQTMSTTVSFSELSYNYGYYVVRLYIYRKDTGLSPAAYGYNLCSAIF